MYGQVQGTMIVWPNKAYCNHLATKPSYTHDRAGTLAGISGQVTKLILSNTIVCHSIN